MLNTIREANEDLNPTLRAIRTLIREPKTRAVEITAPVSIKGQNLQPGTQLPVVDPRHLPSGFISAEDAVALLQAGAARAITESMLQAEEAEL